MRKKSKQQNKILRVIAAPYRALCKARDFYVNTMIDCANSNSIRLQRSSNVGGLPRSYSTASSRSEDKEDYLELVRAASARGNLGISDHSYYIKNEMKKMIMMRSGSHGNDQLKLRSSSVAMVRIDEDNPGFLEQDDEDSVKFPRSKSHAVSTRTVL